MQDLKTTIKQMTEIQDILFNTPPNDKGFNKKSFNYTIELFNILTDLEQSNEHYSEEQIQKRINNLHNKIFKNRRY